MPEIQIPAHDGGSFKAYIALPEVTPAPTIIMIQEIFGINQEMRDKCDEAAANGYIAICPDLFWRIEPNIELVDSVPEQLQRAFELFGIFDIEQGINDLKSTLTHARADENNNGRVGCAGYCLGGKLAYMLACNSDIDASVTYYGVGIQEITNMAANLTSPLLMHIAEADEFVPPEAQTQIKAALGEHKHIAIHSYPSVQHAFARGHGMHYDEAAATLANTRTADFFDKTLGTAT